MTDPGEARKITDTRALAAMTDPLRRRLLDLLEVEGPATASVLAGRTGQAVGSISHHLRVLGRSALIEEAPELARDRRERWWRIASSAIVVTPRDLPGGAVSRAVQRAHESLTLDRHAGLVRASATARESGGPQWRDGAFSTDGWLRLTPGELGELEGELTALFSRWAQRRPGDDGQVRENVFVFAYGVRVDP